MPVTGTNWYNTVRVIPKIKPVTKAGIKEIDVNLLKSLFEMQTPSLDEESQKLFINQVLRYVRNKGIKITTKTDSYGNVYVTKGTAGLYPCIVS